MTEDLNFEKAFARLEEILERMNQGKATLDESLKLYEEADGLIGSCTNRLNKAQEKIEILIKNRQGELAVDTQEQPVTEAFHAQ